MMRDLPPDDPVENDRPIGAARVFRD